MEKFLDTTIGKIHFVVFDLNPGLSGGYVLFVTDNGIGSVLSTYEMEFFAKELGRIAASVNSNELVDSGYKIKPLVQVAGVTCNDHQVFVHGVAVDKDYFIELADEADELE